VRLAALVRDFNKLSCNINACVVHESAASPDSESPGTQEAFWHRWQGVQHQFERNWMPDAHEAQGLYTTPFIVPLNFIAESSFALLFHISSVFCSKSIVAFSVRVSYLEDHFFSIGGSRATSCCETTHGSSKINSKQSLTNISRRPLRSYGWFTR
jgi:hypothetical protein